MTTRRRFLQASAASAGGLVIPWTQSRANAHSCPPVPELLDPTTIAKFVDPLPIPALLKPTGNSVNAASYKVTMTEFQQQLLPKFTFPTN